VDGVLVKGFPTILVKKPSSILKIILERLGTSQDVEMVNDYAPAEIEEILAQYAGTGACRPLLKRPKRDDGSFSLLPKGGSILSSFQIILEGVEPFSTNKERGK
jgi:hypothetical protein